MTMMWKAAAAFILAIGAGGFVAGSVLGDPGAPDVGEPVVLNEDGPANQPGNADPTARPKDDDGTPDQGGGNDDDDDLDTIYHTPDDLDDDDSGRGRGRGRGGDDVRDDNSGPGSADSSGPGSGDDSGDDSGSDDD